MFCPSKHVKDFINDHYNHYKDSIKEDMKQGKKRVILRELCNYESFYTGDINDCLNALKDYPITTNEIREVFTDNWEKYS